MSLFSFLGKVVQAGLSVATGGISDKVISVAKTILGGSKTAALNMTTANQVLALKHGANVKNTERIWSDSGGLFGGVGKRVRTVLYAGGGSEDAGAPQGRALPGSKVRIKPLVRKKKRRAAGHYTVAGAARRGLMLAAARTARTARRKGPKKGKGKRGGGRRAPTGGLDLKAASVSWRAAGKPGKWLDWVKSHG